MSIQTLIDNAKFISINKSKVAAKTVSRSGRVLTSEIASAVPFRIVAGMHQGFTYSNIRDSLMDLDVADVTEEIIISINNLVTDYQGDLTQSQINQIATNSSTPFSGSTIYLNTTGVSAGSGTLFKKGDYIQIGPLNGRYPYMVTSDVTFSSSTSLAVPVHRPVMEQSGYPQENRAIAVGNAVDWRVKLVTKPKWSIIPHNRVSFSQDIEFVEIIRSEDG